MKKFIYSTLFIFCTQFISAQDFKATEKYTAKNQIVTKQEEYKTARINIVSATDSSKKIATIAVSDTDLFDEVYISVLEDPNLENIQEVVKVEIVYVACCANSETYYYLATNEGDFIKLPTIDNMYCDIPQPSIHYTFPNQPYGKENTILATEINYTESNTIKDLRILKSFVWNDDFNTKDAITAIQ